MRRLTIALLVPTPQPDETWDQFRRRAVEAIGLVEKAVVDAAREEWRAAGRSNLWFRFRWTDIDGESAASLRHLYRRAARLAHPDGAPTDEQAERTRQMAAINDAYGREDGAALRRIVDQLEREGTRHEDP